MAAVMKFDTLSWAKKLQQAGVPSNQAELQVELVFRAIDDNICTKQDLREHEGNQKIRLKKLELKIEEVRRETKETRGELELKIEEVRREIKETRGELELKIEEVRREIKETRGELELKIEVVKSDLELKIEGVRRDLELKIEEVRREIREAKGELELKIEGVKTSLQRQIAGWVLGVSAVQATVIIGVLRYIH